MRHSVNQSVSQMGHFNGLTMLHILVLQPGSIRIGAEYNMLLQDSNTGLTIANTDGIKSLLWSGDLYGANTAVGSINVGIEMIDLVDALKGLSLPFSASLLSDFLSGKGKHPKTPDRRAHDSAPMDHHRKWGIRA